MTCPACGAAVEEGADLCLECGEPMGDSPAAQVARNENVLRPPPQTFTPPPPAPTTRPATRKARTWPKEEPEPPRCPGCGIKSQAARCPGCGTRLRTDDE
jgi:predicted amidophosphoribosyltransferase